MFESIDNSPIKKVHLRITALSSGGSFLDGYDISIISIAVLVLPFSLTSIDITLLLGSTLLGMVFGGVFIGYLTDIKGRRYIYLWDMAFFILFTFLTAISFTFVQLLVFRLLLGIAIGADYAISPTIIAEFAPARHRGKLLSFSGAAWFIGAFAAYGIGAALIPAGSDSWKFMFLVGIIPAVIIMVMRHGVPESPRWLANQGNAADATNSMKEIDNSTAVIISAKVRKTKFSDLFSKKYIAATFFVSIFWFILDAVTYVIALYGPTILTQIGISSDAASRYATLIALMAIIGAVIAIVLIDRSGRKNLTSVGFAGMFVTLIAAAAVFRYFPDIIFIVPLFVIFEISQELGPGITSSIYPQELYPTEIRSTAQGFATTVSRIGALAGIFSFAIVKDIYGLAIALVFLGLLSALGVVITLLLGKETKGKSLEDLSDY